MTERMMPITKADWHANAAGLAVGRNHSFEYVVTEVNGSGIGMFNMNTTFCTKCGLRYADLEEGDMKGCPGSTR